MAARITPGGGPKTDKVWRDAIMRAVKRRDGPDDPQKLDKIADAVVAAALNGDMQAAKEIGDRLDGKPAQQQIISGDQENPLNVVSKIERIITRGDAPN